MGQSQDLEKKFEELKDKIIAGLKAKGSRLVTFIMRNEEDGLGLHVDDEGSWGVKIDMGGYPIYDSSLDSILDDYAFVVDSGYREIDILDEEKQQAYIREHCDRLLQALVADMERVTGELAIA